MKKFNNVEMDMVRGTGYGQYEIYAKYKGILIKTHTTDSEAWDYFNDDSNKKKHRNALRHCYYKIVNAYNQIKDLL